MTPRWLAVLLVVPALTVLTPAAPQPFAPLRQFVGLGELLADDSCRAAGYLLVFPCPDSPDRFHYVAAPANQDLTEFVGRFVSVRGTVESDDRCQFPVVAARQIVEVPPPPCPGTP